MKLVSQENVIYQMDPDHCPVLTVAQDEPFALEVKDCYSNNLKTRESVFTKDMWETVNPATGPVFVERASPGSILAVHIDRIEVRGHAVMCLEEQSGPLGDLIEGVETTHLPVHDDVIIVNDALKIPIRPMIGVIGVAPENESILNGTPGEHGGNMDCKEITAGATVFLPVNVEGALLAMGDLHAIMGDGEVCTCGAEISGKVTARAKTHPGPLPTPCVDTPEWIYFIGSAPQLDACAPMVLEKAHTFLTTAFGLSANEAARLMSLVGELQVCQVVNPLKTMRFGFPKRALAPHTLWRSVESGDALK